MAAGQGNDIYQIQYIHHFVVLDCVHYYAFKAL